MAINSWRRRGKRPSSTARRSPARSAFPPRNSPRLEARIANAADRALGLELAIFDALAAKAIAAADAIKTAAGALAAVDVAAALAALAVERAYVRPDVDASRDFVIIGGRHPVVEQALARETAESAPTFVANDCDLSPPAGAKAGAKGGTDGGRIYLVTGPNMGGKSTYLRQNALIAVLAQMGSFVPAKSARIGVVDRLFSRVGAADDLARGRSTFMVEMVETAAILNQATARSLVILDEIGRGTATFDGLSIAWAAIEHLHDTNRCRALFATHFHELTALAAKLPRLFNATVRVKEWHGDVVFLARGGGRRRRPLLRHRRGQTRRPAGERDRPRQARARPARGGRPRHPGAPPHRRPAAILRRRAGGAAAAGQSGRGGGGKGAGGDQPG